MICPDCGGDVQKGYKLMILHQTQLHHDLTMTLERVGEALALGPTLCEDCGWSFPEQDFDPKVVRQERRVWKRYTEFKRAEFVSRSLTIKSGYYVR